MTMGLPQSSQSMSVAMLPLGLGIAASPPVILAIISADFSAPSFRSGTSASICACCSGVSLLAIFVLRHLGKVLQPRNGPRLLSRSSMGLPHFSQGIDVLIGFGFGGSGLPSLSRLMMTEQLGSPASFFML